jgi:hypothetical protein
MIVLPGASVVCHQEAQSAQRHALVDGGMLMMERLDWNRLGDERTVNVMAVRQALGLAGQPGAYGIAAEIEPRHHV